MESCSKKSDNDELDTLIDGCRFGRTLIVAASLIEMSKKRREKFLTVQTTDVNDELLSLFLLSVRNGRLPLVRLFLTMFSIDPNSQCHIGNVNFDGYMVDGATPLWCAAAIGSFDLVKILVEHGAEINFCTSTNSSPLRAACFGGSFQIVQFLIENGADMEIANLYGNTCLMVASYRGHLQVVKYLLHRGAKRNSQDSSKCTAYHYAVDGSRPDIVKVLVEKGADIHIVNESRLTPGLAAANNCNSDLVKLFSTLECLSLTEKIHILELLGASYANDKNHYDLFQTYSYFYLAILMREKDNIPKVVSPPVPAYLNRKECETREELEAIRDDWDALHMESLIARERILGSDNVEIPRPITYRGAVYADRLEFSRSISLWQRAMDLKQKNNKEICSDLFRFAEVFSHMSLLRQYIDVNALATVLTSCLLELKKTRSKLEEERKNLTDTNDMPSQSCKTAHWPRLKLTPEEKFAVSQCRHEGSIHAMLYLLLVVTISVKTRTDSITCGKIVYQFVKCNFRDRCGSTPLHLVLDGTTPVDDYFHVKYVCSFPNYEIAKLLLSCGADPNATSNDGNTPLHLMVQYAKPLSDFMTLHTAIMGLLEAGAHPDTRNSRRESPLDLATTGVVEAILKKESLWSLKCFAARVIQKYNVPFRGQVPVTLEKFIEMH